jgi:hypothetical protein
MWWGADQDVLFKIHQAVILSVIEYEAAAYGSSRKSILEKLNSTHHQGLRIALGAFRSTWIKILMCEAGSSKLDHQRLLIIAKTAIRSKTINEHPIKRKQEDATTNDQNANWIRIRKPFHIRAMDVAATLNITSIIREFTNTILPWVLKWIRDIEMLSCRPSDNNDVKLPTHKHRRLKNGWKNWVFGSYLKSNIEDKTTERGIRLHCWTISHLSGTFAYWKGNWSQMGDLLRFTQLSRGHWNHVPKIKSHILTEIQDELAKIGEMKTIKFVWTPGHAGITKSNEKADEGAKEVLRQCLPPQSTVVAVDIITRAKFNAKKNYRTNLATWLVFSSWGGNRTKFIRNLTFVILVFPGFVWCLPSSFAWHFKTNHFKIGPYLTMLWIFQHL